MRRSSPAAASRPDQRYKEGHLQIDVIFIPVTRDRLVPALLEGHGDVAT